MRSQPRYAVVVANRDGTLISQNATALRLMGEGQGRSCWRVVGALPNAGGLPCEPGCVGRLLEEGSSRTQHAELDLGGQKHRLSCIPAGDFVLALLCAEGGSPQGERQLLTAREQEVLRMLAVGETTSSIAERLEISPATVRTHVQKMRSKLAVRTRAGLVAIGFRSGYLS